MTKVAYCGDLHFGKFNNSRYHNGMLMKFVKFLVDKCNEEEINYIIFTGDYFDNRQNINVMTLHHGIQAMRHVNDNFNGEVYSLVGNHDMYHKDRLDVTSTDVTEPYCDHLIKKETIVDIGGHDVLLVPWVCDNEHWDQVVELSKRVDYCFGHFEFKKFKMNDHYVMEHGFTHKAFKKLKRVLSGHFHIRQKVDNVIYPGSPFPFDFNDANTEERGFGIIDLDTNENEFVNFNGPKIRTVSYKDILDNKIDLQDNDLKVKVLFDGEVSDNDLEEVKTRLEDAHVLESKIDYVPNKIKDFIESDIEVQEVENIDDVVLHYIRNSREIEGVNKNLLESLYKEAIV